MTFTWPQFNLLNAACEGLNARVEKYGCFREIRLQLTASQTNLLRLEID